MFENRQRVAFNIASETSYVYILSGLKLIKIAKNGPVWRFFCCQTVLSDMLILIGQKMVENAKIQTFECDILSN